MHQVILLLSEKRTPNKAFSFIVSRETYENVFGAGRAAFVKKITFKKGIDF